MGWLDGKYTFDTQGEADAFGMNIGDSMSMDAMNAYGLGQASGFTAKPFIEPGMFQGGLDFLSKNKDAFGVAADWIGLAGKTWNTFGPERALHKKNMQLADQHIAANKEALDRRNRLNDAYAKSFGGGLAASAAKVG